MDPTVEVSIYKLLLYFLKDVESKRNSIKMISSTAFCSLKFLKHLRGQNLWLEPKRVRDIQDVVELTREFLRLVKYSFDFSFHCFNMCNPMFRRFISK